MWLVGGLIYFFTFLLIFILNPIVSKNFLFKIQQIGGRTALFTMFFRVKINYKEKIDNKQNYIFMANHVSLLDVLVMAANLPHYTNAIEAESHFKWFFYGRIIKIFGQIPINRKSVRSSIKSFQIARERLKNGRSILVFPEGTRSRSSKMNEFKSLPFKFAMDAKTGIVPVGLVGFEKINVESFWVKPGKLTVNYGNIIPAEVFEGKKANELKEIVRQEIIKLKQN